MPVQPETRLQNQIRLGLQQRYGTRLVLFRNHSGVVQGLTFGLGPGSPDLVGWFDVGGRAIFLGIEIKTGTGRLRANQQQWIDRLNAAGGIGMVARTIADAAAILDQYNHRNSND